MAELEIILQGLSENDDHETAVNQLLTASDIDNYLFSLAFARKNGVERIEDNLKKVADKSKLFIGIRNGITSVQSIFQLLKIGLTPYVVDTASNKKIFHPKIYAAYGETKAYVILGSANLTFGGLNQNIEASSYIKLNRRQKADEDYLQKLVQTITELTVKYPEHVFQITSPRQAVELLYEGRLEDERLTRLPVTNKTQCDKARDNLKPIPIVEKSNLGQNKPINSRKVKIVANTGVLVWESKPLAERSLNIPHGNNTNITGDTNLGEGLMENIDFQHYFRETVFSDLEWRKEYKSRNSHLERAIINAEIVIKNLSYGEFKMEVTHDPRTDTKSYMQRNVMTKIKWGEARGLIASRDLLGRTLRFFKKNATDFMIVID
ncbi:hypothetical protein EST62_00015 [Chlorobaculum sp. 24CR]|uniref:phospholipase D family protein n=1 Tax=Chlorobaculum sp. 24CR TaxID=2508878 RepID=UPI00100AE4F4|nr:phospholipase D family protein [Chlorobaculum sp. 24CR]RXK89564.1 hypothetical protein EST62_00015 [Chlorobaculum sp. 24CR]